MMRRKRCRACQELYPPEPRSYRRQKTCDQEACRDWRKRQYQKVYRLKDPLYWEDSQVQQRLWRAQHPDYWRAWRQAHPAYVERNRQLQKRRDGQKGGFLAKEVGWKAIRVAKLAKIKDLGAKNRALRNLAKEVDWARIHGEQIDGICGYLREEIALAK